jgi:hypothetical protein
MKNNISAKDFLLHISVIVLLYVGVIALLNLLFRVINVAYPQVSNFYYSPSISMQMATLIVVFPLFLILSRVLRKSFETEPEKREYPVRKWLIYITLFVAGAVLAGNLISLIFHFLDGRELTAGFLLKVLAVFVVIGSVFGYFLDDLKGRLSGKRTNYWIGVATVLVVGSIVAGFAVFGSPATQRAQHQDQTRINDLQSIQWQVLNYYQDKREVPSSLDELADPLSGFTVPRDPKTDEAYEYSRTGNLAFELCATFAKDTSLRRGSAVTRDVYYGPSGKDENWDHSAGYYCFERSIDPERYPVRPR